MDKADLSRSRPRVGASPGSTAADLTGQVLGDFAILRRLGQGGMGQVYLAEQISLKRKTALKILKAELAGNAEALQRFKAEAEAVARATHAAIVQVYAVGEARGLHYMALEYVEGCNLKDYLARKGPPSLVLALTIMRQVAAALQRAGELGIVHRDIKPENILLTRKGEVKVADFGLSRCFAGEQSAPSVTQTGMTLGTPLYMSPEQVEGKPLDSRSDIYSFGVTCYHLLAGRPPFQGASAFDLAVQHVQVEPAPLSHVRPDLPADLIAIIHKMLAKRPEQRYQTGRELLRELTRLREALAGTVRPSESQTRVKVPAPVSASRTQHATANEKQAARAKRIGLASLVFGSILLALAVGALLGWQRHTPPPVPEAPEPPPVEKRGETPDPLQQREQALRAAVARSDNPPDEAQLALGVEHRLQLALFYLEQWRLDEADHYFTELIDNPAMVKPYSALGALGHAMVLAFRDQAQESVKGFLDLFNTKEVDLVKMRALVNGNPQFVQVIARAAEFDAVNYEAQKLPFPAVLQELRRAQPLPLVRPAPAVRPKG
jgi:serine/threonine-protein kinase